MPAGSPETRSTPSAWELLGLAIILIVFALVAGPFLASGPPLGHDEAVYARRARAFAGGDVVAGYWQDYRAPGLPALMSVVHHVAEGDGSMRAVPFFLALTLVCLAWLWTRTIHGPRSALLAAGMLAGAPGFASWAWQIGVDIPGAAFGLAAITIFTFASGGERVKPWGLAAIPVAMAAAYVRFGAPVFVGAGMTAVAIAHRRAVRHSPGVTAAIGVGMLASMFAVLKVPALTGAMIAPADAFAARQAAKSIPFTATLAGFWDLAPTVLGPAIGLATAIGLGVGCWVFARQRSERGALLATFAAFALFIVGLAYGVAEGFVQYLVPGLPFLFATTAAGLTWLLHRMPRMMAATFLLAMVAIGIPYARSAATTTAERLDRGYGDIWEASIAVRERQKDEACLVLTSYTPQAGWYTRCTIVPFPPALSDPSVDRGRVGAILDETFAPHLASAPTATIYTLVVEGGKRQPPDETIRVIRRLAQAPSIIQIGARGARGSVTVDLLADHGNIHRPDPT